MNEFSDFVMVSILTLDEKDDQQRTEPNRGAGVSVHKGK